MEPKSFQIRPVTKGDRKWVSHFLEQHWQSPRIVSRGAIHNAAELPGFVVFHHDCRVALATYRIDGQECEIVTMNSTVARRGIGSALLEAIKDAAVANGCNRLWLVTTNDNTLALHFYQKRGFSLVKVHRDALEKSRKLKPEIPEIGIGGIPLRDEIEFELRL